MRDGNRAPLPDFVLAGSYDGEAGLRLMFRMTDAEWADAQERLAEQGYFAYTVAGYVPVLPG